MSFGTVSFGGVSRLISDGSTAIPRPSHRDTPRFLTATLAPADAARFAQAWNVLQARFIDNPKGVVVAADHLVTELMVKRGYPMGDFAHRAADISVDHPGVVATYRAAAHRGA